MQRQMYPLKAHKADAITETKGQKTTSINDKKVYRRLVKVIPSCSCTQKVSDTHAPTTSIRPSFRPISNRPSTVTVQHQQRSCRLLIQVALPQWAQSRTRQRRARVAGRIAAPGIPAGSHGRRHGGATVAVVTVVLDGVGDRSIRVVAPHACVLRCKGG